VLRRDVGATAHVRHRQRAAAEEDARRRAGGKGKGGKGGKGGKALSAHFDGAAAEPPPRKKARGRPPKQAAVADSTAKEDAGAGLPAGPAAAAARLAAAARAKVARAREERAALRRRLVPWRRRGLRIEHVTSHAAARTLPQVQELVLVHAATYLRRLARLSARAERREHGGPGGGLGYRRRRDAHLPLHRYAGMLTDSDEGEPVRDSAGTLFCSDRNALHCTATARLRPGSSFLLSAPRFFLTGATATAARGAAAAGGPAATAPARGRAVRTGPAPTRGRARAAGAAGAAGAAAAGAAARPRS